MGKPESTPSHKENECTRVRLTHEHTRNDNEQECKSAGIGEVPIQLQNDNMSILNHARHVPELKRSLVSIGILAEDGYKTTHSESS